MEEYLTTKELSNRIKMEPGTIRNLVWKKDFKINTHYLKPTPRKLLFIWSAVQQWLQSEPEAALPSEALIRTQSLIDIS